MCRRARGRAGSLVAQHKILIAVVVQIEKKGHAARPEVADTRLFRYVGEGLVSVVSIQTVRPAEDIDEIDVQVTVAVVVSDGGPRAEPPLLLCMAGQVDLRLGRYVHEGYLPDCVVPREQAQPDEKRKQQSLPHAHFQCPPMHSSTVPRTAASSPEFALSG